MPYLWTTPETGPDHRDTPCWHLCLWPNRSLPPQGFVVFIGLTAGLLSLPLIAVLGSPVLWGLLPFLAGTVWLLWYFLQRSYADGALCEKLRLSPDQIELLRSDPRKPEQSWQANPYWVRVELHPEGGKVDQYLTLTGAGRTVEIGAFLSPDERKTLYRDLSDRLRSLDVNAG